MKSKRVEYLDIIRGIAIILVVIGHVLLPNNMIRIYIYTFHLPIFFVISGILLSYTKEKWLNKSKKDIIYSKLKKILYPYLTFSILSILIIAIKDGIKVGLKELFSSLIFDGTLTLWYLPTLFIGEILIIICAKKMKLKSQVYLFLITILITTLFCELDLKGKLGVFFKFGNILNRSLIGYIFIYIGYFYDSFLIKHKKMESIYIFVFMIMINIVVFYFFPNKVDIHYSKIGNPILFYVSSITAIYCLIYIGKRIRNKCNLIKYYGRNSLVVFLTHLNLQVVYMTEFLLLKLNINNILIEKIMIIIFVIFIEYFIIKIFNNKLKFLISYENMKLHLNNIKK